MAVGASSSQSLRVQVGTRYRDQDPGRASSLGRCLLALGMYDLSHRAAPPFLCRAGPGSRQSNHDRIVGGPRVTFGQRNNGGRVPRPSRAAKVL